MAKIEVEISEQQMAQIKGEAKEEWNATWSRQKLLDYLRDTPAISAMELLREYGVYDRYEKLKDKPVGDLTRHERLICSLYWTMYESFGR